MNPRIHQRNNYNDLIRLSTLVTQRRIDQRFLEDGLIIYIVDSDIVKLYSAPDDMAIDKGRRQGYCQFFKKSSSEQAKKLAIALSEYLFNKLSKDIPLLVFDAQLTEINDICSGVMRDFYKSQSSNKRAIDKKTKSITDRLSNILIIANKIDTNSNDETIDEQTLIQSIEGVSEQLLKSLAFGKEISRLNHILNPENPKLTGIPYLLEQYPKVVKKSFFEVHSDVIKRSNIRSTIQERLKKVKPKPKKLKPKEEEKYEQLLENDVSALSNLFFLNKNLIESKEKFRFVLISGDEKIVQASDVLTTAIKINLQENCPESSCSFSDLFIRHPLSFINDEDFIGDLDYDLIDGVENELRSLLRSEGIDKVREFDDVASLMQNALPLDMDNYPIYDFEKRTDNISKIFDTFLDKRLATYSVGIKNYTDESVEGLLTKLRESKSGEEALREIYNEANNIFVKETNTLAFNLNHEALASFESIEKFCYRIPPFLRFDKVTPAETYIKSWVLQNDDNNTKDLYKEVEEKDPSGYSITLCNAAIWAFLDDWKLVQENAGRAFKIAIDLIDDGISNDHNLFLGHEAAYLSVVSTRHLTTAKSSDDVALLLKNLRNVIDYTKLLWNEFRKRNNLESIKPAEEEYRFIHELLSINLMEIWYEVFYFGLEEKNTNEINQIIQSLSEIKGQLLEIIQETEKEIDKPENEGKIDYLRYAQRHAINNYCLVFLVLDKHKKLQSNCCYDNIKYVLNIYHSTNNTVKNKKSFKVKSYLHACTMAVTNFLYLDMTKKEKKVENSRLYTLLTEEYFSKYSRKPYEKQRYLFYREIIGHA